MSEMEELRKQIDEMKELRKQIDEMKRQSLLDKVLEAEEYKELPVELVKKLIGSDEGTTKENLELLKKHMSASNTTVSNIGKLNLKGNPWSKEHFNLTLQGEVLKADPELAKKYMAEA